jgi:hypothetical protein
VRCRLSSVSRSLMGRAVLPRALSTSTAAFQTQRRIELAANLG